ncbi:MAG: ATP-binding protein [Anaerolineae bacterium]
MQNPFVYGKVARGEYFADREEEIRELIADIASSQNVIIFSPRRYGKTSLILEVLDRVKQEDRLTVYLDLFKVTSKEAFITAYAKEITRLYKGGIHSVLRKVKDLLPRLIPKVTMKGEGTEIEMEFEFDSRGEKAPLLADLFEAVATISTRQVKRAVVVFDEFQEIVNWDEDNQVERLMRSHLQLHQDIAYIFMGSKRHLMQDLFQNKNRPFYRFGKHFPLGKIPRDEFRSFIRRRLTKTGFQVDPEAIDGILHITEDHPYYTQLRSYILWDRKREEQVITKEDVHRGVREIFLRESHAFHDLWEQLPLKARQLLVALAKEERSPVQLYSNDFLTRHNLGSASSVQRAIARLQQEEILEKVDEEYQYTDLFFKRWIREQF